MIILVKIADRWINPACIAAVWSSSDSWTVVVLTKGDSLSLPVPVDEVIATLQEASDQFHGRSRQAAIDPYAEVSA